MGTVVFWSGNEHFKASFFQEEQRGFPQETCQRQYPVAI